MTTLGPNYNISMSTSNDDKDMDSSEIQPVRILDGTRGQYDKLLNEIENLLRGI